MNELQQRIFTLFSIPVYAVFIPLEIILSNFRNLGFYSLKESLVNIYLNLLNVGIDLLLRFLIGLSVLYFFYKYRIDLHLPPVMYWALLLLGEDFMFWLEHFVDHNCRLFWAVHVTHHSSPEYNLSTGFRSSVFMPVYKYFYFIPLVLLGFHPSDIIFMYSITQVYGILVHTQFIKKAPAWVEYIFVTPGLHRVHHASNIPYLDKNMGMVFIIWDRLFGTYSPELPEEKPHYGITKPIDQPHHPIRIVTHEWEALAKDLSKPVSLITKLRYVFNPPGWSHDGSTKTSKQLQQETRF
ncbi:MAG: sterol desaturase family protein [Chitinophagaceae bacterium]|nr:sterol desaturase family protein [Chitinophagaceae bacterium]